MHQGELVQLYGRAGLPNPPAPERPRVEIVSTKRFLRDATRTGAYGDIAWVGVLQPNVETTEYGVPDYAACGLTAPTTCGALYHSADGTAPPTIEHTVCNRPAGSESDQLALE